MYGCNFRIAEPALTGLITIRPLELAGFAVCPSVYWLLLGSNSLSLWSAGGSAPLTKVNIQLNSRQV